MKYGLVLLAGLALGIFGYAVIFGGNTGTVRVAVPGAKVELAVNNGEISFLDVVSNLFATGRSKLATKGILEGKYGYFDLKGAELAAKIRSGDPKAQKLAQELRVMLVNFQGPFEKKHINHFRDISKPETIDEMGTLFPPNHPVAQKIQDLCLYNEGVCKKAGKVVHISVPGNLKKGNGAVCRVSRLLGMNVMLQNPKQQVNVIEITLRNSFFPCVENKKFKKDKENVIQLSEKDRKDLFPNIAGLGPIQALMFPNPPGTTANLLAVRVTPQKPGPR